MSETRRATDVLGLPLTSLVHRDLFYPDPEEASMSETREERDERRAACKALRLSPNTKWAVCGQHGRRGRVEDVYYGNLAVFDDSAPNGLVCDPTHPGCFDWFEPHVADATRMTTT